MGTRIFGRSFLVLSAVLAQSSCTLAPARDATDTAQRYANALNAHNYDTMVALTDPEVLKRTENGAELRRLFPQIFGGSSGRVTEEISGISPGFSDSTGIHYFVNTSRDTERADGTGMVMNNYYIVTSRDLGRTWTIVDISCVDERWIKGVAPGWTGFPSPPQQSVKEYSVDAKILGSDKK
jgi:hypothetical protein